MAATFSESDQVASATTRKRKRTLSLAALTLAPSSLLFSSLPTPETPTIPPVPKDSSSGWRRDSGISVSFADLSLEAHSFAPSSRLATLICRQHLLLPNPNYMQMIQAGKVSAHHRQAFINWCMRLTREFEFDSETTYLAVNYMERYLSITKISRASQLFLLASSSVYLAAKFGEELKEPCIADVAECSMRMFDSKEIKRMEARILKDLKWELLPVTPQSILSEMLKGITLRNGSGFPLTCMDKEYQSIMHDCQVYFDAALLNLVFLRFQPATLVFSVLSVVSPSLFKSIHLNTIFRFDMNLIQHCANILIMAVPNTKFQ